MPEQEYWRWTEHRHTEDVGRQQVAGELDAMEIQPQGLRKCMGEGGLSDAGQVLNQQVAAGQQAGDREPDLVFFTKDDSADLGYDWIQGYGHVLFNFLSDGPDPGYPAVCTSV